MQHVWKQNVWIVYVEQQNGEPEIYGIFEDEQDAHEYARDTERDLIADGLKCYPRAEHFEEGEVTGTLPEGYDENDWDVDVHVDMHGVEPRRKR